MRPQRTENQLRYNSKLAKGINTLVVNSTLLPAPLSTAPIPISATRVVTPDGRVTGSTGNPKTRPTTPNYGARIILTSASMRNPPANEGSAL